MAHMSLLRTIWLCFFLLTLTCKAATFVVNVPQSSYQAEEKHSITLEWTFPTKPDSSWSSLYIICELRTDHRVSFLYHIHEGAEVSESQDEEFAGRVQSDKDALREGRLRLNVSRLRTEDSGLYLCEVKTDYGSGSGRCRLNVTGDTPVETDQCGFSSKNCIIMFSIGVVVGGVLCGFIVFMCKCRKRKNNKEAQNTDPETERLIPGHGGGSDSVGPWGGPGEGAQSSAILMEVKAELEKQMGRLREQLRDVEMKIETNKKELRSKETEIAEKETAFDKPVELLREKEELLKSQWKLDETKKSYKRHILNLEKLLEPLESLILN